MPRTCSADRLPDGSLESPSFWLPGLRSCIKLQVNKLLLSAAPTAVAESCRAARASAELAQTDAARQPACCVYVDSWHTWQCAINAPSRSRKDPNACDEGCQRCPSSERIGNSWVSSGLPAKCRTQHKYVGASQREYGSSSYDLFRGPCL